MFTCTLAQYVAYKTNVAQQFTPQKHYRLPHPGQGILGPALAIYASQPTPLPSAFSTMPLQDPTWHMGTGASYHLNFNTSNLSTIFDKRLFPSVHVGDGKSIPITNTGHSIIPSHHRPLHLHNVLVTLNIIKNLISVRQFTRENNCTIEFDAFGFSMKDYLTRHILLRCDSSSDLYLVTKPLTSPITFLSTSASTWHQCLRHPGDQWPIYQLDVKNAFLNGDLSETVSQVAYLLIYVDDIILTTSSPILLQQIIDSLHKEFDMTDLEALNYFLGIFVVRHPTGLFLSQKKYARQLLERAHMVNCNPPRTPIDTDSKLGPNGVPAPVSYIYSPRFVLCSSTELGLQLYASATTSLVGYTDADWVGCPSTCSAEAKYRGVANVVAETKWIRNLLRELHSLLFTATMVYYDNVNAVYMSANPVQHQRTKHIEIDTHFVRDMVKVGHVRVLHVPSCFQYADIFTKGLPSVLFEDFHSSLSVRPPPAPTVGVY
ncbi:ribonuclease H-like domain-containing protein [Tanacetum coccineum]